MVLTEHQYQRFMKYVIPIPESGCWLWTGSLSHNGYGAFSGAHTSRAHRLAYEYYKEPIPANGQLDHLCRVRCCVNPDHLEVVTNKTNVLRGIGVTAENAKRTHCIYGHAYTEQNTRYRKTGGRACRECHQQRKRNGRRVAEGTLLPGVSR